MRAFCPLQDGAGRDRSKSIPFMELNLFFIPLIYYTMVILFCDEFITKPAPLFHVPMFRFCYFFFNCSVLPAALLAPLLPSSASALVREGGVPCMEN